MNVGRSKIGNMFIRLCQKCFCYVRFVICLAIGGSMCNCATALGQTIWLPANKPFVHPGLLHSEADLELMKQKVAAGEEPWKSGFEKLKINWQSLADWENARPV